MNPLDHLTTPELIAEQAILWGFEMHIKGKWQPHGGEAKVAVAEAIRKLCDNTMKGTDETLPATESPTLAI